MERPTVPKAETTSKSVLDKVPSGFFVIPSENEIIMVTKKTQDKARKNITITSLIIFFGTDLPKIITRLLFFIIPTIAAPRTAKVVVFIPPPVDPGEAPTNIRKTMNIKEGTAIFPIGKVLNPAVLAVTD